MVFKKPMHIVILHKKEVICKTRRLTYFPNLSTQPVQVNLHNSSYRMLTTLTCFPEKKSKIVLIPQQQPKIQTQPCKMKASSKMNNKNHLPLRKRVTREAMNLHLPTQTVVLAPLTMKTQK